MNRFRKAWLALIAEDAPPPALVVPEEPKEPPTILHQISDASGAEFVTLYRVHAPSKFNGVGWDRVYKTYATCEQAHAENPGSSVHTFRAIRIDGNLYYARAFDNLESLTLQPKPKVAKGRK